MSTFSFLMEVSIDSDNKLHPTGKICLIPQNVIRKIFGEIGPDTVVYYIEKDMFDFNLIINSNN